MAMVSAFGKGPLTRRYRVDLSPEGEVKWGAVAPQHHLSLRGRGRAKGPGEGAFLAASTGAGKEHGL